MNKYQLKKVMEYFGYPEIERISLGIYGKNVPMYGWKRYKIYHKMFYAHVAACIPYELANDISNKYPNDKYQINVFGMAPSVGPSKFAEKGYIPYYEVFTVEGLVILLSELEDYYARKNNEPETKVKEIKNAFVSITKSSIEEANPGYPIEEWLSTEKDVLTLYHKGIRNNKKNKIYAELRNHLTMFDRYVNPFMMDSDILLEPADYLDKVNVETSKWDDRKPNSANLYIEDTNTNEWLSYLRNHDGFSFIYNNNDMKVYHYFSNLNTEYYGENIIIWLDEPSPSNGVTKMVINLTAQKIDVYRGEEITTVYSSQRKETIKCIAWAISYISMAAYRAKQITIGNMTRKDNQKVRQNVAESN